MTAIRKNPLPKVGVVIPAYNEATTIAGVIHDIKKCFKKAPYLLSIIVVNDGSQDKTGDLSRKNGATVIDHILNCGAGGATATGLGYVNQLNYDIAVTMDADGQHVASDVLSGVERLEKTGVDLMIGSRLIDPAGMSRIKILGNRGLSFVTYILFGINVSDSQSGLRIFSKKALKRLRWRTSGYEFCSEMLWRAKQQKMRIDEYPIRAIYTDYSRSKGQNNWNSVNNIKSLLKLRIEDMIG